MSLIYKSAIELAEMIRNRETTSTEVVKEHFEQIEKHNSTINAVIHLMKDKALKEAAACDTEAK